ACAAHFAFWYGTHLFEGEVAREVQAFETLQGIHPRFPDRQSATREQLAHTPGKLLVFVRYFRPTHLFQDEWVYNEADLDAARIVFARDLGVDENQKLIRYYPTRRVWLLEPEFRPPRLRAYLNEH